MKSNLPRAHGLLSPIQKTFIHIFLQLPDQEHFYLTGGTALAEYYLGHRLSYDLDFYCFDKLVLPVSYQLEKLAQENQLVLEVIRRFTTYVEILVNDRIRNSRSTWHWIPPSVSFQPYLIHQESG